MTRWQSIATLVTFGFAGVIALCAGLGTALAQRDAALARERSATRRADACVVELDRETEAARVLEERVRTHLAIDDDRCPCSCGGEP